ncbi:pyrroline-5-carboxylate reductase 3-like isoform X2 [Oppia nitens]|uniref:pyrroline-5-carboxylate reductase 3-like isoform X2 n=1 Tax=Oppia nitens TaxID=1686743 RepID=UPI0023DC2542|nr:pyrroline-5-carboxylate reductase 3-like isoform X2 [Oppia nitens]
MESVNLNECLIGFIGAGNMALALATGLIGSRAINPKQISASSPTQRIGSRWQQLGCHICTDNNQLFGHLGPQNFATTKVVFLCVKPNVYKKSVDSDNNGSAATALVKPDSLLHMTNTLVIVSVMAGVELRLVRRLVFPDQRFASPAHIVFARLMPNTAVSVGAGVCGTCIESVGSARGDNAFKGFLKKLLAPLGLVEFVDDEHLLNAVCGLAGSGIAFVYTFIHAMADGGLKMGLPRTVATSIAAQTVKGAALMVEKSGQNTIALRDEVTSPAGTTIHGLHALESGGFAGLVMSAIELATKRAEDFK